MSSSGEEKCCIDARENSALMRRAHCKNYNEIHIKFSMDAYFLFTSYPFASSVWDKEKKLV